MEASRWKGTTGMVLMMLGMLRLVSTPMGGSVGGFGGTIGLTLAVAAVAVGFWLYRTCSA